MSLQNYTIKRQMLRNKKKVESRLQGKLFSIPRARAYLDRMLGRFKLAKGVTQEVVKVGAQLGEWHTPKEYGDRVILYLHGGGYFSGSLNAYRSLVSKLASSCAAKTLAVTYRLAPEHPFPAAQEDALFAFRWLQEQGIAARNIIIIGDSAGGGLALSTALALRDAEKELPRGLVLMSPWVDLSGVGDSYRTKNDIDPLLSTKYLAEVGRLYAGKLPLDHPAVSPLFADFIGLCPTFIQVGTEEILLDDSMQLRERMEDAAVDVELQVWDGSFHVWQVVWPYLPEARRAIRDIARFVKE